MKSLMLTTGAAIILVSGLLAPVNATSLDDGVDLFQEGDYQEARTHFEAQLLDEDSHGARYYLGRIALEEGDADEAIEMLEGAVELNEASSEYRGWLGRAYIEKLQTVSMFEKGMLAGRALENLQKAVDLDPSNVMARMTLAGYYLNAPGIAGGSKKKAREQIVEIVKYEPVEGNALLASLHVDNEEYDQAIEKLRFCIDAEPENPGYHYQLAMVFQKQEQFDAAFEEFDAMLALDPDSRGGLYQTGRTAVFAGARVDRGIECLEKYLTLEVKPGNPEYDSARWRLGMLYEHKGDLQRAHAEYEAAMSINPDNDAYSEALASLDNG
jgi:tetratricopeptide (TPR) repeat protein